MKKLITIILIFVNLIVLTGQLWPEGAPPFARTVNIIFLIACLLYFSFNLKNDSAKNGKEN